MTKIKDILGATLLIIGIILWIVLAWGFQTEFGSERVPAEVERMK
jgi:hypothetical protein